MIFWITAVGAACILAGILMLKKTDDFSGVMEEELADDSDRLKRLELEIERQGLMIDKFEKMLSHVDFESQSVDEIIKATGMKKGEVLLLKRLLEE